MLATVWSEDPIQHNHVHGVHATCLRNSIFKQKSDTQESQEYRGIKLLTHIEIQIMREGGRQRDERECTEIQESQFGFMPGRRTTCDVHPYAEKGATPGRPESHKSNIHDSESLRSVIEGGDI